MRAVHITDLDITQIRLLAALVGVRKLSVASDRIGLSQSAASHALARMRQQSGDALFTRCGDGVQPTPYGERLGLAAQEALDALNAGLTSNQPFQPAKSSRRFNIYTSDIGQMVFLPKLTAFLHKEAPDATVRVLSIPLDNPGAGLRSGEVDVAVGFFNNLTSGFLRSLVFEEHYVCIVRAGHRSFRKGMSLEAFVNAKHAIADSTGMAHAVIDQILARHHIRRRDTVRVPGFHVLPTIIANSDLLAVIPNRLAQAYGTSLPIKIMPVPVSIPSLEIQIYWHERFHHDPANQWFRGNFVKLFRHG